MLNFFVFSKRHYMRKLIASLALGLAAFGLFWACANAQETVSRIRSSCGFRRWSKSQHPLPLTLRLLPLPRPLRPKLNRQLRPLPRLLFLTRATPPG